MRFYAAAAVIVLALSSIVWLVADRDAGTILTIAGVLFWASGATLVVIGLIVLGRRLSSGDVTPENGDATVTRPE